MRIDKDVLRVLNENYETLKDEFMKGVYKYEQEFLTPYYFTGEFLNGFEIHEDGTLDSDSSYYVSYTDNRHLTDPLIELLFVPPTAVDGFIIDENDEVFGCSLDNIVFDADNDIVSFDGEEIAKADLANYVYDTLKVNVGIDLDAIKKYEIFCDTAENLAAQGVQKTDPEAIELKSKFKDALIEDGYKFEYAIPTMRGRGTVINTFENLWKCLWY